MSDSNLTGDSVPNDLNQKVLQLVALLADKYEFNWTRMSSHRDSADTVLLNMADLGIIEHREHELGGHVWIFEGKIFGRTDGVELPNKKLKPKR